MASVDRRGVLGSGLAGFTSLALPGASSAASLVPTSSVGDDFTVAAVEDRTIEVTWTPSGFTDTIEYRPDGEPDWIEVTDVTSPARITTTASWASEATSAPYEVRVVTSSGGVRFETTARTVTAVAAVQGGDLVDLINVEGELFRVHTFLSDATPTLAFARTVEYLLVGGGGGGGARAGGGGGAGEVVEVTTGGPTLAADTSLTITIGLGGAGGTTDAASEPGSASSIDWVDGSDSADGGVGGGYSAGSGGASGGGSTGGSPYEGAPSSDTWAGGGGAGANGNGEAGSATSGGTGGQGVTIGFTGGALQLAGGGGGGAGDEVAAGGPGGTAASAATGAGAGSNIGAGADATANTGSGGGGGYYSDHGGSTGEGAGGRGGSGRVAIRYRVAASA